MKLFAVVGNPIQHSLSPVIHAQFAQQTGIELEYTRLLAPVDGFVATLKQFQQQGGYGVNITSPFKREAADWVEVLTERAAEARAVNTILFRPDGVRVGDNTDGVGLVTDLTRYFKAPLNGKRILLLGAGGAAQGVLGPLLRERPLSLTISNRTVDKAEVLAESFSQVGPINACHWTELRNGIFDIIINATSASLQDEKLNLPNSLLNSNVLCYDMVYGKGVTPFLQWANAQNAICLDGLGMLVEQAAESFYIWHHIKPNTKPVLLGLTKQLVNI